MHLFYQEVYGPAFPPAVGKLKRNSLSVLLSLLGLNIADRKEHEIECELKTSRFCFRFLSSCCL